VRDLVALLLPGGPDFVAALQRTWDDGDAVLPLDPTAPPAHTGRLLDALRPTVLVTEGGDRERLEGGEPVEEGDAVVVATSGTTGEPKGAVHTHRGIEHAAFATTLGSRVEPGSRWLACLPLSHVGGLSVVTRALLAGTDLVVHPGFDVDAVAAARAEGATHVSLVPTALARIDPTGWRTILLGGSAIPADRPPNTIATYGMTETFGGVVYDGQALGGTVVRITDGAGRELQLGEVGTIELRSPALLRAYRDGADPVGPDGWYRTGDVGFVDPVEQRLHVQGRGDDLIITGGEKVWPVQVEGVLEGAPGVREVAVAGVADAEWGQRVVAFVVPEVAAEPPTLDQLRELARAALPVAAAPKELRLVDSLPRTGLGKIRRSSLPLGDPAHGRSN
jgi:O-succinylbenzoic acid--CoA ligase